MNLREQFEKLHPVPKNVVWLPSNEMYWTFTEFGETDIVAMKEHNALWQGFQSGHAAGLEDAAKFLDEWNTAIGDDLAKSIRAMKEPK